MYRLQKGILPVFIALIVVGAIATGGGTYTGIRYYQAKKLVLQADKLVQSGNYAEAVNKYRAASKKFWTFKNKVASKIDQASEWQKAEESIAQAQASINNNEWQQCLDGLKEIKAHESRREFVKQLSDNCQLKLDEVAKAAAEKAAADAAALTAAQQQTTQGTGSASSARPRSSSNSSSGSGSSSNSDSNGPTIGQTSDQSSGQTGNTGSNDSGNSSSSTSLASCSGNSYYNTSPINTDDLLSITPLGNFSPSSGHIFPTGHIYFFIRRSNPSDWNSAPVSTNIYAPGDITITHITASEHITDGYTDYSITFAPCSQISSLFGHVTTLTQDILDSFNAASGNTGTEYKTGNKRYRTTDKSVSICVSAGTQLGTAGGRADQNALDFGTTDTRSTLSFANNSRWSDSTKHSVCPIDYYSSGTKNTLTGYLGYLSTKRTSEPVCGEVSQDRADTAQGAWIKAGGSTFPEDPNLSLAHDNVEPNYGAIVAGTSLPGVDRSINFFAPTHSGQVNREFSEVSADGNVYCYETSNEKGSAVNKSFLVQLTTGTALKIQKNSDGACGSGPWSFSDGIDFER